MISTKGIAKALARKRPAPLDALVQRAWDQTPSYPTCWKCGQPGGPATMPIHEAAKLILEAYDLGKAERKARKEKAP